ncbi:MAG: hypothetical protein BZ151_03815 [Desulfobacca sp. 4484_104]|nr:MAG: hypothetical protein BZ151_03815 [Desulfobacca sp. 4484_104]RLA91010.1 MAG: hypothetical protein DRG58_00555 [Deltaproteobacteria bacterium]
MITEEARLVTVRNLSRATVEFLAPAELPKFETDFARWAVAQSKFLVREGGLVHHRPRDQALDTTLVAGMFFQVMIEAEGLPVNNHERTRFVKQQVKNFLVQRLAGEITLSQFFRLMNLIEEQLTNYFAQIRGGWLSLSPARRDLEPVTPRPALAPLDPRALPGNPLREALAAVPLPQRGNRKLTIDGLIDFLTHTQGDWFRLLDFETYFRLNKKTAWLYLSLLLQHEILRHNEEKANRVRYALAPRFLPIITEGQGGRS